MAQPAQPVAPAHGKELIELFLELFHYLNKSGKRAGFIMFNNKGLTQQLETLAKNARAQLHATAKPERPPAPEKGKKAEVYKEPSDQAKWQAFIAIVDNLFKQVENTRASYGSQVQGAAFNQQFKMVEPFNGYMASWKKPYQPARFEKELVKALQVVANEVADRAQRFPDSAPMLNEFKTQCDALCDKIQNFKPEARVFACTP